ncbi:helix-turn-helix transcriptional regulator [Anaerobutyricum hallii]|uniref:helix-turn-helix domain-containing protein n=1 Tax=Anaerobutyricum hallii TaxID=39488 RepID=UPI001ADD6E6E|nr:helix-turn-helix domain-containing protein [Anaerobutyricum hallii]MBP0064278.1 helix-turn-helix transcriptional regulator [Anaerobutyricum hallii]
MKITQPTLAQHMKRLGDWGRGNDRKEGKWHHYDLNKKVIREASSLIEALGK